MGNKRQRGSKRQYPESAHIVRDYATLKNIAQAFAAGQIKLLILLGGPGKGKGQIVKRAMQAQAPTTDAVFMQALSQSLDNILARLAPGAAPQPDPPNLGPGLYIKGFVSPISFHIAAYNHRDAPICIDDADAFFADAQLRERTKHLSETDKYKLQAHRTLSKELIAEGVPQEFWTTSPVCIIRRPHSLKPGLIVKTWSGSRRHNATKSRPFRHPERLLVFRLRGVRLGCSGTVFPSGTGP